MTEDAAYLADCNAMHTAWQDHRLTVGDRSVEVEWCVIGCCLLRLFRRLRDNPEPVGEGEILLCGPSCPVSHMQMVEGVWRSQYEVSAAHWCEWVEGKPFS